MAVHYCISIVTIMVAIATKNTKSYYNLSYLSVCLIHNSFAIFRQIGTKLGRQVRGMFGKDLRLLVSMPTSLLPLQPRKVEGRQEDWGLIWKGPKAIYCIADWYFRHMPWCLFKDVFKHWLLWCLWLLWKVQNGPDMLQTQDYWLLWFPLCMLMTFLRRHLFNSKINNHLSLLMMICIITLATLIKYSQKNRWHQNGSLGAIHKTGPFRAPFWCHFLKGSCFPIHFLYKNSATGALKYM